MIKSGLITPIQHDPPFRLRMVRGSGKEVDTTHTAVEMNQEFSLRGLGLARVQTSEFWIIESRLYLICMIRDSKRGSRLLQTALCVSPNVFHT
jgi:hypothetical protein